MSKAIQGLIEEAYSLIAHWESPARGITEHTADFVSDLRKALVKVARDNTLDALPQIAEFLDDMSQHRDSVDWDICGDEVRTEAKRLRAMLALAEKR